MPTSPNHSTEGKKVKQSAGQAAPVTWQVARRVSSVRGSACGLLLAPLLAAVAILLHMFVLWCVQRLRVDWVVIDVPLQLLQVAVSGYCIALVIYWLALTCAFAVILLASAAKAVVMFVRNSVAR
jgi:hypothetical protein